MKKSIIINEKYSNVGRRRWCTQGYNLELSPDVSIVDLPRQIGEVLIHHGRIIFKAVSWCMFPVIWAGDIMDIEPIKPEDAKRGDIVLYKDAGRAYAHRLVKRYHEDGTLYIVTTGEKEYRENRFDKGSGISADSILGRVVEIRRGRLCFKPDELKLTLRYLMKGRLKLLLWTFPCAIRQYVAKIFARLQRFKLYRYFLKGVLNDKIEFFAGTPLIKSSKEINKFCLYQRFCDFFKSFDGDKGLYHITARINRKTVGSISLSLDRINNHRVCALSNLIVKVPYRGGGIGRQLVEKVVYLCDKIDIDEIRVVLLEDNEIPETLFKKLGFEIGVVKKI
ncbi:MAG: GNAT family N-acetyltransferase [Candidatus Omnitrophica bacterium]|nr:GNAT family N-acetyltransferase [Candidatus Omnitrophota bacterium]